MRGHKKEDLGNSIKLELNIFGYEEGIAEYELISMVLQINKLIGISDYTIKINHLGDQDAKDSYCNSFVAF